MAISGGDGSIILTTKVDETGLKKGLGSMKKIGATAGKAFLAIGAAAATATVAITKMATDAYADYEQMVGGVETLWGKSAKKIIDYANDAFYTAGQSANDYMRQVTMFSVALIRGTAGDTEKAADIANMAMIDIADNVARLGTDIKYVELAYQGFARNQYLLLDNLRIGYGGTRQEMERLLRDAQAITGVKYDINNLADVYTAIHVIQEELGIAGSAALEAEKTITGSARMMKAAWQNVLTAIAGGGDLDRAINNLVYSITKYFENIVPVVQRSLVGIGKLIEQVAPLLVQNVASALIQSIPSLINAIYQMIIGLAKGIWQGIRALFTGGGRSVTADIKTSVGGVSSSLDNATDSMNGLGDATDAAGKAAKAAGKEAKKSLAAFDDLQIVSSGASAGSGGAGGGGIGGVGGGIGTPTAESVMDIQTEETGEQATWLSERLGELAEAFSGLKDIDLSNLSNSLKLLKQPLQDLAEIAWDTLLWGIENVIVPLTTFYIEEALPRFFTSLSLRLQLFNAILEPVVGLAKQFYDEFLRPIASYAADEFLQLWDTLNENLGEFVTIVKNSTAWQDLQTILGLIYDVLEPVVKWLIDFVVWVGKLTMNNSWTDLKWVFLHIEDALGLIADIINGDFSGAWEHLKDLMWDNRIDKAKEKLDNLKDSFAPLLKKVKEFVKEWKVQIDDMIKSWKDKIKTWWEDDVEPWFTLEKWRKLFANMVESLGNFFDDSEGFVQTWLTKIGKWWDENVAPWFTIEKWETLFFNIGKGLAEFFVDKIGFVQTWEDKLTEWWDNNVAPWFTAEKWKTLFLNICTGIGNFFVAEDGFVQTWAGKIGDWWTDNISPWFTADKWKELFLGICDGIRSFFSAEDGFVQTWTTKISDWWTNNVAPWFTLEKWQSLGQNIKDGIVNGLQGAIGAIAGTVNRMIDGFQSAINGAIGLINKFADGWNAVADLTPLLPSVKKIKSISLSQYKIPGYARGTVVPPNKPFLGILGDNKNETEVVSPISTLKQAFAEAMIEMGGNFGGGSKEIVLEVDGREFGRAVVDLGGQENRRIGTRLVIA